MKTKEILDQVLTQLEYEDIQDDEGLSYLLEIWADDPMEMIRNHLRNGYKNIYYLPLPPVRNFQSFIIEALFRMGHRGLPRDRFAHQLGLNPQYFQDQFRQKRKAVKQAEMDKQKRMF